MSVCGIIAEFNPLHNGHKYLIDYALRKYGNVICALSGNFTQRGEPAIISKADRVAAALKAGVHAVYEMPVVYSMSTAQNFALCGVLTLYNAGCDTILFGSETGDIAALLKTADILLGDDFKNALAEMSDSGETFAALRQKAAEVCGAPRGILKNPNDNLGIEYIIAAKRAGLKLNFEAVLRVGTNHDGTPNGEFASASYIRDLILNGKKESAKKYMPECSIPLLSLPFADIKYGERAILGTLRSKNAEDFKNLPDISEGIENRLSEGVKTAGNLDELYTFIKTKRYTLSRVRRLVLSAALGFDDTFFLKPPPYSRLLGSRSDFVSADKNRGRLFPIVSRAGEIEKLSDNAQKLFRFENAATDIYALCFKKALPCGTEYKMKYIKI